MVLNQFYSKSKLVRRESTRVRMMGKFGDKIQGKLFPMTLKLRKIHVLGDALSGAPHSEDDHHVNYLKVP